MEKAFDNIIWNITFYTLQEIEFELQDLKILLSLYKQQTAEIKRGEVKINAKIKKGMRQGILHHPYSTAT